MYSPKTGFTLVELLVVIAIISILAALVLPSLQQALSSARGASCLSNKKQIGLYLQSHADEHDNWLPASRNYGLNGELSISAGLPNAVVPSGVQEYSWAMVLAHFNNLMDQPFKKTTPERMGIFNCPENRVQIYCNSTGNGETSASYAINGFREMTFYFKDGAPRYLAGNTDNRVAGNRTTQFVNPSHLFMTTEHGSGRIEPQKGEQQAGFEVFPAGAYEVGLYKARYPHLLKANVLLADLHVETLGPLPASRTSSPGSIFADAGRYNAAGK